MIRRTRRNTIFAKADPYYSNVSLLLPLDGAHQSNIFRDYSSSPKVASQNGNAQISNVISIFGGGSLYCDGSGDFLTVNSDSTLNFGASDFTMEAWVYAKAYPVNNVGQYNVGLICKDVSTGREFQWVLNGTASSFTGMSFIGFSDNTTYTVVSGSYAFQLNTWYHVACVRSGNLVFLFVDGILLNAGGTAFSRTLQATATTLRIGAANYDGGYYYYLNGHMDSVRITKGIARYTANFIPHGEPLPME